MSRKRKRKQSIENRKNYIKARYLQMLNLDLDYNLASMYEAMQNKDENEINKINNILIEITKDIERVKQL